MQYFFLNWLDCKIILKVFKNSTTNDLLARCVGKKWLQTKNQQLPGIYKYADKVTGIN